MNTQRRYIAGVRHRGPVRLKPSAPLPVPQWIVDDARLVGRSRREVGMEPGTFVQVNTASLRAKSQPVGYIIRESGCWEWTGARSRPGYGVTWAAGRYNHAHRVLYERHKGPIPLGRHLDHLCRNRACVNPDHLEAVSNRENILRGVGAPALNARKTHCKQGHAYTPENTYRYTSGWRRCLTCHQAWAMARKNRGLP